MIFLKEKLLKSTITIWPIHFALTSTVKGGIDNHVLPFLNAAWNALSSRFSLMTIDTQMTLPLLQELLMALKDDDAGGYKS